MRSTSALGGWRKKAWPLARVFVPRRARWFYEGHPALDGQLWYAERRLLYETVRHAQPRSAFEIGTWKGGGSTLFIAQALCDNGGGVLHTIEFDEGLAAQAQRDYRAHLPHLLPYVRFHVGDYRQQYRPLLDAGSPVDFLLLDGAEDAGQTLAQCQFFLPHVENGSVLLVHDWFTEKARLVKEALEGDARWRLERVLTPPRSVGFALLRRGTWQG